ncbi:DNA gyrase inhibitor YacG [uncultured Tateyamaria sp.]|uniref:DNA gyrase inhibitor YacG n=1 Tax=uncultured Tateyamaria sp. TaxID=455651 RepID=UPI002605F9B1|nr:DNA gyrase inhibitor YacG [uncultured Tateyamaria sp.]
MTCPICNEQTVKMYRPFCSRRCADIDLARWMNGAYAVPSQREDERNVTDEDSPFATLGIWCDLAMDSA